LIGVGLGVAAFLTLFREALSPSVFLIRRDTFRLILPLRQFWLSEITSGRFPTWYPYDGLGQSFIGAAIASPLDPLNLIGLILPPAQALKWQTLLQYPIAAIGGMLLARRLRLSPAAQWLVGMTLLGAGYLFSLSDNYVYLHTAAALPWALWAAEGIVEEATPRAAALLALVLAWSFVGGDVQGTLLQSAVVLLFVVGRQGTPRWRRLVATASGACAFLLLVLPLIPPILAVARASGRLGGLPLHDSTEWCLHPLRIIELLIGPAFTRSMLDSWPKEIADRFGGHLMNLWATSEYIGAIPLLCSVLAIRRTDRLRFLPYALLAATALLLSLGTYGGVYALAYKYVPLWHSFRYPEKLMPFTLVGVAILAGAGLDAVRTLRDMAAPMILLVVPLVIGASCITVRAVSTVLALLADGPAAPELTQSITATVRAGATVALLGIVGWALVVWAFPAWGRWLAVAITGACAIWANSGAIEVGRTLLLRPPPLGGILSEKMQAGGGRLCSWPDRYGFRHDMNLSMFDVSILGDRASLAPDHSARFGIGNIVSYFPTNDARFAASCGATVNCGSPCSEREGARWNIVSGERFSRRHFEGSVHKVFETHDPWLVLFEDSNARPLVSTPAIHFVQSEAMAAREVLEGEHDAPTAAIMVGKDRDVLAQSGVVRFERPQPNHITAELDLAFAGYTIIAEQCSKGWRALLDGTEVKLETVDSAMCAVKTLSGKHHLDLRFTPPGWPWAWLGPLIGLGGIGASLALRRRRDRKTTESRDP